MALIKCPECGKEISDRAVACPNCGCPIEEIISNLSKIKKDSYSDSNKNEESNKDIIIESSQIYASNNVETMNDNKKITI